MEIANEILQYLSGKELTAIDRSRMLDIICRLSIEKLGEPNIIAKLYEQKLLHRANRSFLVRVAKELFENNSFTFFILKANLVNPWQDYGDYVNYAGISLGNAFWFWESFNYAGGPPLAEMPIPLVQDERLCNESNNLLLAAYVMNKLSDSKNDAFCSHISDHFTGVDLRFADTLIGFIQSAPEIKTMGRFMQFDLDRGELFEGAVGRLAKLLSEEVTVQPYCQLTPANFFNYVLGGRFQFDEVETLQSEVVSPEPAPVKLIKSSPKSKPKKTTGDVINHRINESLEMLKDQNACVAFQSYLKSQGIDPLKFITQEKDYSSVLQGFTTYLNETMTRKKRALFYNSITFPLFDSIVDPSLESGPAVNAFLIIVLGENPVGTKYQWILRHEHIARAHLLVRLQKVLSQNMLAIAVGLELNAKDAPK